MIVTVTIESTRSTIHPYSLCPTFTTSFTPERGPYVTTGGGAQDLTNIFWVFRPCLEIHPCSYTPLQPTTTRATSLQTQCSLDVPQIPMRSGSAVSSPVQEWFSIRAETVGIDAIVRVNIASAPITRWRVHIPFKVCAFLSYVYFGRSFERSDLCSLA